jgi:two-component system, OmpR family, sensor kinase
MSIRLQLTLWHTAVVGLVLAGFAALVYVVVAGQLSTQFDYVIHLQALEASRVAHGVAPGAPGVQSGRLDLPVTAALGGKGLYVQLIDRDGRILASSNNRPEPLPTPSGSLRAALSGREDHAILSLAGDRVDLYTAPLVLDDGIVGALQVAASLQPLEGNLSRLRLILATVVVAATALVTTLGWFLATKAMRPVDRITRTAQAIGRSADLSRRLAEPRRHDELGRLAATFNEMLAQLEAAGETQRRFLADASHELRTPLAVIRTSLETLLRDARSNPPESRAVVRAVLRETQRAGCLVSDLLALARADAGQPLGRQRVALDTLVLEVYHHVDVLAEHVALGIGAFEQVEVEGDPDRLKQAILNLVDNAVRYTPASGVVTIDLFRRDDRAVVRVRDTGPGIPPEHLPRIFDRFYRVDEPRSRQVGGTGLGLAICRWVAEAHGGRVVAESAVGVGSTFTLWLPVAGDAAVQSPPARPLTTS